MHEIAHPTTGALVKLVLSTWGVGEVSYWRKLRVNWSPVEPPIIQITLTLFSGLLVFELYIRITIQVGIIIFANHQIFYCSVFQGTLYKHILDKVIELQSFFFLFLFGFSFVGRAQTWILAKILDQDRSWIVGSDVLSCTSVTMTTSADLEVECADVSGKRRGFTHQLIRSCEDPKMLDI